MPKLAIISSYNENCGNASYTHVLKNEFARHLDVDVISLDLFVLQKLGRKAIQVGDNHIDDICKQVKGYDYVNIQFEAGLYGSTISDIRRRIFKLIEACPNLIFTMHRIDPLSDTRAQIIWRQIKRRKFREIQNELGRNAFEKLYFDVIEKCNLESRRKNVWICVHTKRERRIVQNSYAMRNCFDHPLAFLTRSERDAAWAQEDRQAFKVKNCLHPGSKVIGLFGYISEYKGLETAIRALPLLPDNYVIALFGSQHPQTIRQQTTIDPYLDRLLRSVETLADDVVSKRLARFGKFPQGTGGKIDGDLLNNLANLNYGERVRFMGNVDDPEFIEALRLCDAVVLPYLEVGQSMSGVIALGVESGATMYCANNLSFLEVRKYYGDVYHTFDIGNYVELAQKLRAGGSVFKDLRDAAYDKYNVMTLVRLHLDKFGYQKSGVEFEASIDNGHNRAGRSVPSPTAVG